MSAARGKRTIIIDKRTLCMARYVQRGFVKINAASVNSKYDLKQNIVIRKFCNDFLIYKNLLIFDYLRQDK